MSENPFILVLQNSIKNIRHMAKVNKKSEHPTPFGEFIS